MEERKRLKGGGDGGWGLIRRIDKSSVGPLQVVLISADLAEDQSGGPTVKWGQLASSAARAVFMVIPAERRFSVQALHWKEEEEEGEEGRWSCDAGSNRSKRQLLSRKGAEEADRSASDLHAGHHFLWGLD